MASIDFQGRAVSKKDGLGLSFFLFHTGVGGFVLAGWLLSSYEALLFYLVLLPAMASQWAVNRGSCLINNVETWLRTGRWRDPENPEEGGFLAALCDWLFAMRPSAPVIGRCSYSAVLFLWLLALGHFSWLALA